MIFIRPPDPSEAHDNHANLNVLFWTGKSPRRTRNCACEPEGVEDPPAFVVETVAPAVVVPGAVPAAAVAVQ